MCAGAARSLCLYTRNTLCSGCHALSFCSDSLRLLNGFRSPRRFVRRFRFLATHPPLSRAAGLSASLSGFSGAGFRFRTSFIKIYQNNKTAPLLTCSAPQNSRRNSVNSEHTNLRNKYFVNFIDRNRILPSDFFLPFSVSDRISPLKSTVK